MVSKNSKNFDQILETSDIDDYDETDVKMRNPRRPFTHEVIRQTIIENSNRKSHKPKAPPIPSQPNPAIPSNPPVQNPNDKKATNVIPVRPPAIVLPNPKTIPTIPNPTKGPNTDTTINNPSSKSKYSEKSSNHLKTFDLDKAKALILFEEMMNEKLEIGSPEWRAIRSRYSLWSN